MITRAQICDRFKEIYQEELNPEAAVSEQAIEETLDDPQAEQKMVPLAAMLATRKKLQDAEARAIKAEASQQAYQEYLAGLKNQENQEPEEDPNALVERKHLYEANALAKRDILETLYRDMNPKAVQEIDKYLGPILEKKPWLASSVDSAQNRYARAYEIVQDYLHLIEEKPKIKQSSSLDGKKIIQNAHKPGSPADIGKSARSQGVEYLKSIQGKKEFREYRQKMLQGEI